MAHALIPRALRKPHAARQGWQSNVWRVITAFARGLGALEPVWDELYPTEQARIMRLLIERIDVAPDGISVTLHAAGIRTLVAELANEEAAAPDPCHEPMLEAAE